MTNPAYRRARRAFWMLFVVAVVLIGVLGWVVRTPASPSTGLAVALLGLLVVADVTLSARLLLALTGRLAAPKGRGRPGGAGAG